MDKLKDYIGNNREAFDRVTPPEGHLERFRERIGLSGRTNIFTRTAIVAAAAILIVFFLRIGHEAGTGSDMPQYVCEAGDEIEELRLYYQMQIYDVETKIKELYAFRQAPGSLELMEETEQVIRATHDFEANIFPSLPCSEAGIFVITRQYGNSIGSLNLMLRQMKRIVKGDYRNQTERNDNNN
ncbi:MAG: hypothetical protein LBI58_05525 [Tannerellaceae bacterium]|jgi:hypothetical protein|nr:hypothetical protein [Tannerellaceae bacterium]